MPETQNIEYKSVLERRMRKSHSIKSKNQTLNVLG